MVWLIAVVMVWVIVAATVWLIVVTMVADYGCHCVAEWKWKVSTTAIKTIVMHHLSLLLVCYIIGIRLRKLHKYLTVRSSP